MNMVEKIAFLEGGKKYCNMGISREIAESIICGVERINYREF